MTTCLISLGIDPGANGAAALLYGDTPLAVIRYREPSAEVLAELKDVLGHAAELMHGFEYRERATIEKVHSMPRQGVASTFKFGANYGRWLGWLQALGIPYQEVTPQRWQGALACATKGNKNVTKERAWQMWPELRPTHATADALLIAYFGNRPWREDE